MPTVYPASTAFFYFRASDWFVLRLFLLPHRDPNALSIGARQERALVLNRVTHSIIEEVRGKDEDYAFVYRGQRIGKIFNSAWKRVREAAGLPTVRVHDLRHTFGRRLRVAGVSLETRKTLLGHKNGDITTHYPAPELAELFEAVALLQREKSRKTPALTFAEGKRG